MNETITLNALVADLARLRAQEAEVDAEYKAALAEFEAEHADLIERRKEAKVRAAAADEVVRHTALMIYLSDVTNQAPHPAVKIKTVQKVAFAHEEAREWVGDALLELNEKAYDKLLREWADSAALASVFTMPGRVIGDVKAYIDRDLSAYLAQPEPETEAVQS